MSHSCQWCASRRTLVVDRDAFHKVAKSFGPFDLFTCRDCGSLGTSNPPSISRLSEFYRDYDSHRPQWYREGASSGALAAQYDFYSRYVLRALPQGGRSWADVGAGHGEAANLISARRPDLAGTTIDIGLRPASLIATVVHYTVDLNRPGWAADMGQRFDLVFSIAVWEHVFSPFDFARECLSLVAPGGTLVLLTPDYGSTARRLLGRRWPYYQPGEHLGVPTQRGASACVKRAVDELPDFKLAPPIATKPVWVGYSIRYLLLVLRLPPIANRFPPSLSAPLPTGLLATRISRAPTSS